MSIIMSPCSFLESCLASLLRNASARSSENGIRTEIKRCGSVPSPPMTPVAAPNRGQLLSSSGWLSGVTMGPTKGCLVMRASCGRSMISNLSASASPQAAVRIVCLFTCSGFAAEKYLHREFAPNCRHSLEAQKEFLGGHGCI